jgi:hypothetical protein
MLCVLMFASIASAATALSISTAKLPAATINTPFSATLIASGGTAPYSWSVNKVPAGLAVANTGVVTGKPTAAGTYSLMFTVKDAKSKTVSKTLSLVVAKAPAVPTLTLKSSLPSPQAVGQAVTFTAGVTNGSGTYEYQFVYIEPLYPTLVNTAQIYSTVNTLIMSPGQTPWNVGTYSVTVYARKVGSTAAYDLTSTQTFSFVPPPAPTGLNLTITYPNGTVHYFNPAGELSTGSFVDGSGAGISALWNTFGLPAGDYVVSVYEKSAFSAAAYDLAKSMTYTLTPSPVVLPVTDPLKQGKVLYEKGTDVNPAGNYYVISTTATSKFDAEWNLIWTRAVGAALYSNPFFDKDGNIVIFGGGGLRIIAPNGNLLTSWNTGITFAMLSSTDTVFIDADFNVYVAGRKMSGGSTTAHLLKYDANGTLQWDWAASPEYVVEPVGCSNGATVFIHALSVDADGMIHMTGQTGNNNQRFVGVVGSFSMTFDAIGNQLSNVSISGGTSRQLKDGLGNYVTIGTDVSTGTLNITKFSAAGEIIWQKYLTSSSGLMDYTQDSFGNIYLLSNNTLPETPKVVTNEFSGVVVTKIDAKGNIVVGFTGGITPEEFTYLNGISADDNGNLFVTTSTPLPNGLGNYKALMKFNAEGKQEWLK